MKSEHRHDLKTNELGRLAEKITPYLEKYSNYILIGLGIVVVVAGVSIFVVSSSSAASAGWAAMFAAQGADDYAEVSDKYPNDSVGAWARLREAEVYLSNGIRESFTNRESGVSDLNKAEKLFTELYNNNGLADLIRTRSLFGMARCTESTSNGDTDPAIELYNKLLQEFDDLTYRKLAEDRVAVLQTDESKDFYAWYHKQNPKPEDRKQPSDGLPSDLFDPSGMFGGTPQLGEIQLPEIPDRLKLPKSDSVDEKPIDENSTAPNSETKPDSADNPAQP